MGQTQAYVTMLCGSDAYVPGVEVLGHSLRQTGSEIPLVVMTTNDVPAESKERLGSQNHTIREIKPIENPKSEEELLYPRFSYSFNKLRAFDLVEFDKVVLLDADTLVLQNIDALFERPAIAAAPDFFMPHQFNSGVMVLCPERALFGRLRSALTDKPSYDGGDQGFLNSFWPDWWSMPVEHRLTPGYNMHHFVFQFLMANQNLKEHFLNEIKVVHYTLQKPWLDFTLTGGASAWWEKFFSANPDRDSEWRRRLHSLQDWSFESIVAVLGGQS